VIPSSRFASDEESYFQVGTALLQGHQDIFWPPITGWLIALIRLVSGSDSIVLVRLVWVAMDTGCAAAVFTLAGRLGRALWADDAIASRLARVATFGYAIYLPAISHAQFATSEIPALLGTLLMLVLITAPRAALARFAGAGAIAGVLCLTRPSLLPLLLLVPAAAVSGSASAKFSKALVFVMIGVVVVGAYVGRNWYETGEATISTNSAYNLYIGNRDVYAEDLNLLRPRATPAQIEFRRQQFSGQLPNITHSPAESQRLALQWIREHPLPFARRASGRLARVFVPKTDVLELLGGEQQAGVFTARSLALLAITNVQWAMVLFGGLAGLCALRHTRPDWSLLFASVIAGALVLCLIAISKPRYSFVFDPILIICAAALWLDRARAWTVFATTDRWSLAAVYAFLAWGWVAFTIFAVSSRTA